MRFTIFALLVLTLCAIALAIPAKDTAKKPATSTCSKDCGDKYDPICAKAKNSSKERLITFGTDCVMGNFNCAHADDPFELKSKGECGGNVSVRLS